MQWYGSTGVPMLQLVNCQQTTVQDMALIGNPTNPPSVLLDIHQTTGTSASNIFRNLLLGGNLGWPMATYGISTSQATGPSTTNSEHYYEQIYISNVTQAVHIGGIQNSNQTFVRLDIAQCQYGIWTAAIVYGWSWQFANNGLAAYGYGADLYFPGVDDFGQDAYGQIQARGVYSELAYRFAIWNAVSGGRIDIENGNFQTGNLAADGDIIRPYTTGAAASADIRLVNFAFGGPTGTAPNVQLDFGPIGGGAGNVSLTVDITYPSVWNLNGGLNGSGFVYATSSGQGNAQYIHIRSLESNNTGVYQDRTYIGDAANGLRFSNTPDIAHGIDTPGLIRRLYVTSTTSSSPVVIGSLTVPESVSYLMSLKVVAATRTDYSISPTGQDSATWNTEALISQGYYKFPGPVFVQPVLTAVAPLFSAATSGAASWSVTPSINPSTGLLSIAVVGPATSTAYWTAIMELQPDMAAPSAYNP